jgi:hypothetical protein
MGGRLSLSFVELVRRYNIPRYDVERDIIVEMERMTEQDIAKWLARIAVEAKAYVESQVPNRVYRVVFDVHDASAFLLARRVLDLYKEGVRSDIPERLAKYAVEFVLTEMMHDNLMRGLSVDELVTNYKDVLARLATFPEEVAEGIVGFIRSILNKIEWIRRLRE